MKFLLKSRRANVGNQFLTFVFFFYLVLISVMIVLGVSLFVGSGYDFRKTEAGLLNNALSECLYFNMKELRLDNPNSGDIAQEIYNICKLDKDVVKENEIGFIICKNSRDCISEINPIASEGSNFQVCSFSAAKKAKQFPQCSSNELFIGNDKYQIITKSNHKIKSFGGKNAGP